MRSLFLFLSLIIFLGCHKPPPKLMSVDISLRNNSTNELRWVELVWNGPYLTGGAFSPGTEKTALQAPWPNILKGKITFIDATTRKPYTVEVPFSSVNEKIRSGDCKKVTIRILDYDKADVVCE
jgi:hypothetical protein